MYDRDRVTVKFIIFIKKFADEFCKEGVCPGEIQEVGVCTGNSQVVTTSKNSVTPAHITRLATV